MTKLQSLEDRMSLGTLAYLLAHQCVPSKKYAVLAAR